MNETLDMIQAVAPALIPITSSVDKTHSGGDMSCDVEEGQT